MDDKKLYAAILGPGLILRSGPNPTRVGFDATCPAWPVSDPVSIAIQEDSIV